MVQLITGFDLLVHPITQSLTWQTGIRDIYQDTCQVKDLLASLASTLGGKFDSFDHGLPGLGSAGSGERLGWLLLLPPRPWSWCDVERNHFIRHRSLFVLQDGLALVGSSYGRWLHNKWPAYGFYWTCWKLELTFQLSMLYKYMVPLKRFHSWLSLNVLFFSCPTDVCDFKRGCFWTVHRVAAQFITVWTF